jgi:hypothetical protein
MAPRAERARLILRPGGPRNFTDQVLGNKIANLSQDAELGAGWGYFEFIHPCRVAGARKKFQPISSNLLGRLWTLFTLTLHKSGRFLPSAPAILMVWTDFPRE